MKRIIFVLLALLIMETSAAIAYAFFDTGQYNVVINIGTKINKEMKEAVDTKVSSNENTKKSRVLLDIPVVSQMPELPRGCEVASLAMLLNHAGLDVDKIVLAQMIRKVPYEENGLKGNPNIGFVGSIYSLTEPGLGVYNKPVANLADLFLPQRIVNLTGEDFYWVIKYLDRGRPVWVINNTQFDILSDDNWEIWETQKGKIKVTYKEHSVLVTGYDEDYIYINDPLTGEKNRAVPRSAFIEGWNQMGRQAITYNK